MTDDHLPQPSQPLVGYSLSGDGTPQSPAVLHFNLPYTKVIEGRLRAQLPDTVTIGLGAVGLGFDLRGVDAAMRRVDLSHVFFRLAAANNWKTKHYA